MPGENYDPLDEFGPVLYPNRGAVSLDRINNDVSKGTQENSKNDKRNVSGINKIAEHDGFTSLTNNKLEENLKTLTTAHVEPVKRRGRPRKTEIQGRTEVSSNSLYDDDSEQTPPHKAPVQEIEVLPPDPWGTWKTFKVTETSEALKQWIQECEQIVLPGWKLKISSGKHNFISVMMINKENKKIRPFAFIHKSTGNIHGCATADDPYEMYPRGNISDPETRMSVLTPTGVEAFWEWQVCHPNYSESLR